MRDWSNWKKGAYRVCDFVSHHERHPIFIGDRWDFLVMQEGCLPIEDEAPVLHGSSTEVRDGSVIWRKKEGSPSWQNREWQNTEFIINAWVAFWVLLSIVEADPPLMQKEGHYSGEIFALRTMIAGHIERLISSLMHFMRDSSWSLAIDLDQLLSADFTIHYLKANRTT